MFKKIASSYVSSFQGLSKEVWYLSFAMFINRAGTMVIPFMSLYLTSKHNYSLKDVAWVLSSFGLGGVIGSYLGGILSDKKGFYPILLIGFISPGLFLIPLGYLTEFYILCLGVFIIAMLSEFSKPAAFVAIFSYSSSQNRTRSISLLRLSIHLGLSLGPFLGGLLIIHTSYRSLFFIDGVTCLLSGAFIFLYLKRDNISNTLKKVNQKRSFKISRQFFSYMIVTFIMTFVYIQLLSTFPLYYKQVYSFSEFWIGILIGINGLLIFLFEMPLVHFLERKRIAKEQILKLSLFLFGASFLSLAITNHTTFIILSVILFSLAQSIGFPFLNTLVINTSSSENKGRNMGFFTISVAIGKLAGLNIGLQLVSSLNFTITWLFMILLLFIAFLFCKKATY
ncbi:putative MFS family arabinose efflux permease [Wenyingzhuangia heitensis]|uniref:MFS family arabinose efflux permease n=1 Tax=Wenyingzhuangia heitensis TaxID=1487859 RepID=A0ABX0U6I6_9FLAO|nr:MFS transporter [Wenyingzhuangia heitensis]NIJ44458.1 putative MFS family arabinose efflux permease [Wenyingzhuangia heitensis]